MQESIRRLTINDEDIGNMLLYLAYLDSPSIECLGEPSSKKYYIDHSSLPDSIIGALFFIIDEDDEYIRIELRFRKEHKKIDINVWIAPSKIGKETVAWKGEEINGKLFRINKKVDEDDSMIRFPLGKRIKKANLWDLFDEKNTKITALEHILG